jgi:hypothetical protein
MRVHHRRCIAVAITGVSFVIPFSIAGAQAESREITPRSGAWGAEVNVGGSGGALLRFSSPRAAWLLGGSFSVIRGERDQLITYSGPTSRESTASGFVDLRIGRRWWSGEPAAQLRPLMGLGVIGGYSSTPGSRATNGGVYGETGATYFFTPHLSLGATGELAVTRYHARRSVAGFPDMHDDQWLVRGNLVRVNASVYF